MKYFVISDVHGAYENMIHSLEKAGYDMKNPNHQLISCGDNFGRASDSTVDSKLVWQYLTGHFHCNKPICIKGNHETIFEEMLKHETITALDQYNGEDMTLASFASLPISDALYNSALAFENCRKLPIKQWLQNLPWYYETATHIFVHGWLPLENLADLTAVDAETWDCYSWIHTPSALLDYAAKYPHGCGKTIVFGHWGVNELRNEIDGVIGSNYTTYINKELNVVGLDGTTALGNPVNVYTFEEI